jgi:hypothetical protein
MNSSDSQGELLPPAPGIVPPPSLEEMRAFFEREALRSAEEIGLLRRQVQVQRTLLVGTLLAAVILSGSMNILTLKQMRMGRDQLNETRPRVNQMYSDFRKSEPTIRDFVGSLQAYAAANRDFQPILEKYRPFLQQYYTGPAVPAPVPPSVQPRVQPSKPAAN